MADKGSSNKELKEKIVRVLWGTDEEVPVVYANQLYLSHAGGKEFNLTFGYLSPPILFGLEEAEIPERVNVRPVAKIVISPDVMEEFVEAMTENLRQYKESKDKEME